MKSFKFEDKQFEQLAESNLLSNALRRLMRRHFTHCSPDYQMFLFLFQEKTVLADGDEYAHFPVAEEVGKELARKLAGINGLRYGYAMSAEASDHREGSDQRRKKLYWVMAWGTACEANTLLARIILGEMVPKFYIWHCLRNLAGGPRRHLFLAGFWRESGCWTIMFRR